jgi:hypothetical protein
LRAWILPSLGWEDDGQPLVAPGEAAGALGGLIHSISPAGYFRWWTKRSNFDFIAGKLRAMRQLEDAQPVHAYVRTPSLYELRQQFEMALLTGDRESAQDAVNAIDYHQLDTASNTRFMQIRLWDQFREYDLIATHEQVAELVQLRLPQRVRLALVRAFHARFLAPHEEPGDAEAAARSYVANVHDLLAGVLDACRPSDGTEVLRSIGYKAWLLKDGREAARLMEEYSDELLAELLSPLNEPTDPPPPPEEQFFDALRQNDWRTLQEIGQQLLQTDQSRLSTLTPEYLRATLGFSLSINADPALAERLKRLEPPHSDTPSLVIPTPSESFSIAAQTWPQFVARLKEKDWIGAGQFLSLEDRPAVGSLSLPEVFHVLESLEELFTDPEINQDQTGRQMIFGSLPVLIKDFLTDPEFPRPEIVGVYRQLLQLWAGHRLGSASQPDANLLLTLADAVLQHDSSAELEVSEAVRGWWSARKVRAMLPFLLSAVDLLSEFVTERGICESLWIDGAEFVRLDPQALSPGERMLWRVVGGRIGLDEETIDDFLGLQELETDTVDPLTDVDLKKVAIVSLREEAARGAAEIIRQRTGAQVLVVTETHAGTDTNSAKNADVVLFVWASTTHAVYRAFDGVREKLVYVPGKGAASIVLTLERWAVKQLEMVLAH